jgi:hypothetical protein
VRRISHCSPHLLDIALWTIFTARRSALKDRQGRVDAALRAAKPVDAAKIALENPPFASKDSSLKEQNAVRILNFTCLQTQAEKKMRVSFFNRLSCSKLFLP